MKKLSLLIIVIIPLASFCQEYPYDKGDTLFYSSTVKFWEGQKVKLGRGSGTNGTFVFINENRTSFAQMMTRSQNDLATLVPLPKDMANLSLEVKKWKKVGSKRMGFKYQLILKGNITYECDILNAIDSKEILP